MLPQRAWKVACTVSLLDILLAWKMVLTSPAVAPPKIPEEGSPKANDMDLAEQLMKLTKEVIDEKTHARAKGCPMHAAS